MLRRARRDVPIMEFGEQIAGPQALCWESSDFHYGTDWDQLRKNTEKEVLKLGCCCLNVSGC